MKTARTLILGTAARLMAISGAQAADLPVKAKAVEYVKICTLYGAGFFYIPGTDTCIKLGGYLRADVTFDGGVHGQPAWSGDLGQQNRYADYFVDRSRMVLTIDTRTATEYGVVRTFGPANIQFTTLGGSSFSLNSVNFTSPVAGVQLLERPAAAMWRLGSFPAVRRVHLRQVGLRLRLALAGVPGQQLVKSAGRPKNRYGREQYSVHGAVRQRCVRQHWS